MEKKKKIDRGITKESLWACLLELKIAGMVSIDEELDIADRISESKFKKEEGL